MLQADVVDVVCQRAQSDGADGREDKIAGGDGAEAAEVADQRAGTDRGKAVADAGAALADARGGRRRRRRHNGAVGSCGDDVCVETAQHFVDFLFLFFVCSWVRLDFFPSRGISNDREEMVELDLNCTIKFSKVNVREVIIIC